MGGNNSGHHPLAGGKLHESQHNLEPGSQALAVSGACATIASDALMNPFDGEMSRHS